MRILWNFASRSRPDKMFAGINNIIEMATMDDYLILLSLDVNDPTVANQQVWDRIQSYGDKVKAVYGFSKGKIDAINRSVWAAGEWDILCTHSDDFVITNKGLDARLIELYKENFPNLDGAVHLPDGFANERLLTYSILGRNLYKAFGYIYHPEYQSLYCDDEYHQSVVALGKYKFVNENWLKHEHPSNNGSKPDAQYVHTESFYGIDRETFNKRKKNNFDLHRVADALKTQL